MIIPNHFFEVFSLPLLLHCYKLSSKLVQYTLVSHTVPTDLPTASAYLLPKKQVISHYIFIHPFSSVFLLFIDTVFLFYHSRLHSSFHIRYSSISSGRFSFFQTLFISSMNFDRYSCHIVVRLSGRFILTALLPPVASTVDLSFASSTSPQPDFDLFHRYVLAFHLISLGR